jgi:hypothetical protein
VYVRYPPKSGRIYADGGVKVTKESNITVPLKQDGAVVIGRATPIQVVLLYNWWLGNLKGHTHSIIGANILFLTSATILSLIREKYQFLFSRRPVKDGGFAC